MDCMYFLAVLVIIQTQSAARPTDSNELVDDNGEARRTEEPYGTQLNGITSRVPPWPQPERQNEKMFILPKKLSANDKIIINGEMNGNPENIIFALITGYESPDYANVACQLEINFSPNDIMTFSTIENGNREVLAEYETSSYLNRDDYGFEKAFLIRDDNKVTVFIGSSYLNTFQLKHDVGNVRFISVSGDVMKVSQLNFVFGS